MVRYSGGANRLSLLSSRALGPEVATSNCRRIRRYMRRWPNLQGHLLPTQISYGDMRPRRWEKAISNSPARVNVDLKSMHGLACIEDGLEIQRIRTAVRVGSRINNSWDFLTCFPEKCRTDCLLQALQYSHW